MHASQRHPCPAQESKILHRFDCGRHVGIPGDALRAEYNTITRATPIRLTPTR